LWGVLYAIGQHDVKKLLAYHSLENIGIIGIGIGVGMIGMAYNNLNVALLGFLGAILHVVNHSIFKILLFFCAGNIYSKTHTRDIELLGGLIKNMPYTSALFIIGSIAICALPPLNGFISEFLIYAGIIMGLFNGNIASFMMMIFALLSLALIGTMAILCFTKVTGIMLLGNPRSKEAKNVTSDVSQIMLVPMFVLAFLTLLIGVFPQFALAFIISPSLNLMRIQELPPELLPIVEVLGVIGFLCFVFFAIVAIVFALRYLINRKSRTHNTWGCGYNKPSSRIQYTASSYADLFISTLKPLFKRISHIKKPKDLFPKDAYYEFEIEDLEEAYIVKPLIKLDEKILTKFERIQNGNMQQYILFGLIFLILMIVGLFFVG
ncbi:hypothetical protein IJ670_04345, partial [bacterium]|nr:hypothetical protein [bacterium]